MALVVFDRVQETTTTSGTGSVTLLGAVSGFQSFAVVGNTNTTYYTITDGAQWEVGIGTYSTSGPTLARTTVLSNSNGNTSPITLSGGTAQVFVTYTAEKSVNLDASGNVTPLGTVASGTWQGTTVGVSYGGTGVTASSGGNSVVLRDVNENTSLNNIFRNITSTVSAAGTTVLTAASSYTQVLTGSTTQTYQLPDATTLTNGASFQFNNNSTGALSIVNNSSGPVATVPAGGAAQLFLTSTSTANGTWDTHGFLPENILWGTNSLYLATDVITGGTWNGGTIGTAYGGTGLTTFTSGGALYATSTSSLTSGTLPVTAGGTAATTFTANGVLYGNGTSALGVTAVGTTGEVLLANTGGAPTWGAIPTTAAVTSFQTSLNGLTPSTASTGVVTLAGTLGAVSGGTSFSSYTTGDIIYASATNTLAKLGAGTDGYVLTLASGVPSWASSSAATTRTTSTFTATAGQTTFTVSYTVGYIDVFRNGAKLAVTDYTATNGTTVVLNIGANVGDTVETVAYSALSLGAGVTTFSAGTTGLTPSTGSAGAVVLAGTLATTNGGTGLTSFTSGGALYATSTSALTTGTLPVASGGTGVSSASITAFNNITGYTASGATGTTSTNLVFSASPTFTGTVVAPTINAGAATALTLQSAGTTAIYADTSQNVGIGTTSPAGKLDITKASNGNAFVVNALGGATPNFIVQGSGEQTFRLYNSAATGSTRTSIKLASRLNTDWEWIAYTDSGGTGTNDLIISNLAGLALNISATRIVSDYKGDLRAAPIQSKTSAYVLVATDAGQTISITTGGVTVNASIFSAGDMVSIFNNSGSSQTITQGTSVTLRLSGTATTGNRTLAQYGVATLLCVIGGATPTFACTGAGLT
jgi:hypothetical protein